MIFEFCQCPVSGAGLVHDPVANTVDDSRQDRQHLIQVLIRLNAQDVLTMGNPVPQALDTVDIKQEFHAMLIIDLASGHLRETWRKASFQSCRTATSFLISSGFLLLKSVGPNNCCQLPNINWDNASFLFRY